jgi:hypothetical protein
MKENKQQQQQQHFWQVSDNDFSVMIDSNPKNTITTMY